MKILFVNEKLGWFGGVEQNVGDTAQGLRDAGHECFLAWGEKTARDPEGYGKQFDGVAACRELGARDGEELQLLSRRVGADVAYFHKIAAIPSRESLGLSIPMVRMVHDHDLCCPRRHKYFFHNAHICNHPAGWRCWLDLAWLQRGSGKGISVRGLGEHMEELSRNRGLDRFLVGSAFMKRELEMNGFAAERVEIVPPVVRRPLMEATEAAREPHVLFVGQLIRGKGVDQLLDALSRVTADYRATIVGEGNARAALENRAKEIGLGDRVSFTGWVANSEIDSFYQRCRVLAVPVRWPEPFGMIGLEAMHHARPVVAFNCGGVPDWLVDGETGFLLPERDVAGFARALERLLESRELATRLGRGGWERVRSEYSFEGYIRKLVTIFEGADP